MHNFNRSMAKGRNTSVVGTRLRTSSKTGGDTVISDRRNIVLAIMLLQNYHQASQDT